MTKYVYSFGGGTADGDGKMRDIAWRQGRGPRRDEQGGRSRPRWLHDLD